MKKVNLLAAAVLAAAFAMPAQADYTPNAYFNGYMRAGVGFDKNGHTNGSDDVAHKVHALEYEYYPKVIESLIVELSTGKLL